MEKSMQSILPQNVVQALCHTLVHSLWQGLLLALLTGLIIVLTRNAGAALRYRLLVSALLVFTVCTVLTLLAELTSPNGETSRLTGFTGWLTGFNYGLKFIHEHAENIIWIWLLMVSAQWYRLLFGLYLMQRLKRVLVKPVSRFWQEKAAYLSRELGILQTIRLLESAIAKVPLVIGYLKPVILIPVGLVNSLVPEQVETILLHELAHIRRQDYLVNILQTVLSTLFFFNPAVLWLSWLIRLERENCCDDVVVNYTQNNIGYIQALVHFEEYRLGLPRQAVALTGRQGSMLGRLERIAGGKNRSLGKLEAIALAVVLLLTTVFIAVSPQHSVRSLLKAPPAGVASTSNRDFQTKKKAEADAAERTRRKESSP
jgi:beta-lactamase regulating signal transducer with metallopeptidase domain